ncbi:MAG TPA: hypothetical protein VI980_10540 [Acidimicrobiia bacterium]|nr:hypothetical protein [Acidimicrobiia bacterium]
MFLEASTWQALAVIGVVGGVAGLIGGLIASADNLFGALLMGVIGGIAFSTVMRMGGAPGIYTVGDDFSVVWAAVGGLILGFVVGRSNV